MTKTAQRIRNSVLSISAAGALLAVVALPASSVFAQTTPAVQTISGANRMETAIAIANQEYPGGPSSHTVIIASGANANLVDSVTAAPLAKALGAPILLSDSPSILTNVVKAYLATNNITTVYLVGADANAALKAKLPSTVTNVQELSGANRYDTAAAIAQELLKVTGQTSFSTVFVASGEDPNLSDALAAAPFAANATAPILFAAPSSATLPGNEASFVTNQTSQTMYVVGAAVGYGLQSSDTTKDVGSATGTTFANAVAVAQQFAPSSGYTAVDLANDSQTEVVNANGLVSYHLVDAITGGPLAAMNHAAILFANGPTITPSTEAFLEGSDAHGISTVNIFGGTSSIPTSTGNEVAQYVVQGVPTVPTLSAITLSGQAFGSGTETAPAVANSTTPLSLSATLSSSTNTGLTGVDLTLTLTGSTQNAPIVTSGGTDLQASATSTGWTIQVPTDSNGQSAVQVTLPSGESGSYTAQFSAPFTVNGQALTDPATYLQFVAPNSLAIAPYGTSGAPYAVPVSTASAPTSGIVPVTVTLPPLNGAAQANVPVTLSTTAGYFTSAQGNGDFGTSDIAYTNQDGQAVFYVTDNTAGNATVTAEYNGGTITSSTYIEWGVSGVPSQVALTVANGQGSNNDFTAANGATVTLNGTVEDILGKAVPNAQILVTANGGNYVSGTTSTAFPSVSPVAGAFVSSTGAPYGDLVTANSNGQFSINVNGSSNVTYKFWYVQNGEVADVASQKSGVSLSTGTITYNSVVSTLPTQVVPSLNATPGASGTTSVTGISVPAGTTQAVYFDAENSAGTDILSADPTGTVTYTVSTTAGDIASVDGVTLTGNGNYPAQSSVVTVSVDGNGDVVVDGLPINALTGFLAPDGSALGLIAIGVTDTSTGVATVTGAVANTTSATAAIDFTSGAANQVSVSPSLLTINSGGSATVTLTVKDQNGSVVSNTAVPLSAMLGTAKGLWITAINGTQLTTTAVYGSTSYQNASTPIPLYPDPVAGTSKYTNGQYRLAYSGVNIANTVSWSVGNPLYVYTNSQGQVTLTLTAGGVGYLGVNSTTGVVNTTSEPATTGQTAYWSFNSQKQITLSTTQPTGSTTNLNDGQVSW